MFNISYGALGAYAIALALTLILAAWLTPARWWRRLTAGALAIVVLGTWGIGTLALWLMQPAQTREPLAALPATHGVATPSDTARVAYRVHEALNLRAASATSAPRIAVVPAGTLVTATGTRHGDWWQLSATVDGRPVQGWSSSLWLRRADETGSGLTRE